MNRLQNGPKNFLPIQKEVMIGNILSGFTICACVLEKKKMQTWKLLKLPQFCTILEENIKINVMVKFVTQKKERYWQGNYYPNLELRQIKSTR